MPRTTTAPTESTTAGRRTGSQTAADLAFLSRAMKATALLDAAGRLAERARKESWTHAEYLVACLQREVSARESHGGEARVRAARFPAIKKMACGHKTEHRLRMRAQIVLHAARGRTAPGTSACGRSCLAGRRVGPTCGGSGHSAVSCWGMRSAVRSSCRPGGC